MNRSQRLAATLLATLCAAAGAAGCGRLPNVPNPLQKKGPGLPVNPATGKHDPPLLASEPDPEFPASARMELAHAFGREDMVAKAYVTQEAMAADRRDGVLDVEVVDAEDGTPVPFARVSVCGLESGQDLRLQARADGRVRVEGVPRVWLGVRVGDPALQMLAARHARAWRFVHGPGAVRVAMARHRFFRFRAALPPAAKPLTDVGVRWERQGAEGLMYGVATNGATWSLGEGWPHAIVLPPGAHRLRIDWTFRPELQQVVLTDVEAADGVRAVQVGAVQPIRGRVAWAGAVVDGTTLEVEVRRRWGTVAFDSTTFSRRGVVASVGAGGSTSVTHTTPSATGAHADPSGTSWTFVAPGVASSVACDVIARARKDGAVVATARVAEVLPGAEEVELLLRPAHEIGGRAVRADGAPLVGADVVATWACETLSPQSVLTSARTDADGSFVLRGLPAVPVRVSVGGQGFAVYTPEPWTGEAAAARDVVVRTAPTLTVQGTVRDAASGLPIGLDVHLQQETTSAVGQGFSAGADGRWRGRALVPGPARVAIDFHGDWIAELDPVVITPGTCDLTLALGDDAAK